MADRRAVTVQTPEPTDGSPITDHWWWDGEDWSVEVHPRLGVLRVDIRTPVRWTEPNARAFAAAILAACEAVAPTPEPAGDGDRCRECTHRRGAHHTSGCYGSSLCRCYAFIARPAPAPGGGSDG